MTDKKKPSARIKRETVTLARGSKASYKKAAKHKKAGNPVRSKAYSYMGDLQSKSAAKNLKKMRTKKK